jgi:hypothetical protein
MLQIRSKERSDEFFMIERIRFQLPGTTNALESFYGHLNHNPAQRNECWASLHKLAEPMGAKLHDVEKGMK